MANNVFLVGTPTNIPYVCSMINTKHRSAGKEIGILARCAHKYFHHKLDNFSIGHAQIRTLHYICKHDGISQKTLARHLHLDKSSVTSQIERLENHGYIRRKASDKDRREKQIYITAKTTAIKGKLMKVFDGWSLQLIKNFSDEEVEIFFDLMDKMKSNAFETLKNLRNTDEENA